MKIVITGVGSIGRRHYRNLRHLGFRDITIVRSRRGADLPQREFLDEFKPQVVYDLKTALAENPDIVFVTNPTSLHRRTALSAIRARAHVFIEKPISHSLAGVPALIREARKQKRFLFVGYQFRYHPQLRAIQRMIEQKKLGTIYAARFTTGEYLPGWHPWENYRKGYSARRDLGGGVVLTQSHDLDTAFWLFGQPLSVLADISTSGLLELDVDDSAEMIFSFEYCPVVSIHLDYLARPAEKRLEIFGSRAHLAWDYHAGTLRVTSAAGSLRDIPLPKNFERNHLYRAELADVIACIRQKRRPQSDGQSGQTVLTMCLAAREASRRRCIVKL